MEGRIHLNEKSFRASALFAVLSLSVLAEVGCAGFSSAKGNTQPPTFGISGTISPTANATGVTITLSGTASSTTITDSSGNYTFSSLANGSYTVTPSKSGYSFSPASQNATVSAADVTGVDFTVASQGATVNINPGEDIPSVVTANPAGTTFVIAPGTYRLTEPITPKDGDRFIGQTACAPPATSCPAIISGSTVIGPLATFNGTNYEVTGQPQQEAVGSNACEPNYPGCIYPEALFFDGVPYQHLNSSTLPTIGAGQWWFDYANHIIYFHDNPSGHVVETSVVARAFQGLANNVTIQNLEIEEFANTQQIGAVGPATTSTTEGINWVVQNNDIRLNSYYGVQISFGWQILDNYIYENGAEGIGGGTPLGSGVAIPNSSVLVQGNVITHNNFAGVSPGFGAGGIKLGRIRAATVRGNTIQFNNGEGIHFDVYCEFPLIDGNLVTDNTDGPGILMEIGGTGVNAGATIRNNIVLRNGAAVNTTAAEYGIYVTASSNTSVYANVVEPPAGYHTWPMLISAAARGDNPDPPGGYLVTTGNFFTYNTVIWSVNDPSSPVEGENCDSSGNDPDFWVTNSYDYNTYHMPTTATESFRWTGSGDNCTNTSLDFAGFQAAGQDVNGTVDSNTTSGFPSVTITSPLDQSLVGTSATISATASDANGISKVEFYVDWTLQSTVTTSPYIFNWSGITAGSHVVMALAYSNAGIRAGDAVTLTNDPSAGSDIIDSSRATSSVKAGAPGMADVRTQPSPRFQRRQ